MSFHVGGPVVCVDATKNPYLEENKRYTVAGFGEVNNEVPGLFLQEVSQSLSGVPFYASRFRPLVARKTSIEIFTRMLTPDLEKVRV